MLRWCVRAFVAFDWGNKGEYLRTNQVVKEEMTATSHGSKLQS
jgi:hypothetical protein